MKILNRVTKDYDKVMMFKTVDGIYFQEESKSIIKGKKFDKKRVIGIIEKNSDLNRYRFSDGIFYDFKDLKKVIKKFKKKT